jgi:hypothetical protein
VVEVIVDDFGYQIDDSLDLLACCQRLVFTEPEEMNDGLWEDDFAYLEVDLFVLEDFYLFDPSPNANILEDADGDIDDGRLA